MESSLIPQPIARAIVPVFWLAAAVPFGGVGWLLAAAGAVLPLLAPRILPLMVLTSCFFYATMAMSSTLLYVLRAYWIAAFLAWLLVLRSARIERRVWIWVVTIACLLAWGSLITTVRLGQVSDTGRAVALEAAVAFVWVLGLGAGWAWLRPRRGRLERGEVAAICSSWLVAVGYGVVQALLGVNEATVPPDIWREIEGFRQYEDVGRHPFASLTANGMAAVSLFPVVLLLGLARHSLAGTAVTLLLALIVGLLTLTRSYLAIVLLLVVLMVPLARTRVRVWLPLLVLMVIGGVVGLRAVDPELLSLSLRLEGDVSSLRADIWTYTLQHLSGKDWLLGMGFGTDVWARFFAPMTLLKELQSPHSAPLEVIGQFGMIGLAVYLSIVFTVVRAYLYNRLEPVVAGVALAVLLVMARELLAASYIFSPSILATYFWILFGMALAQLPEKGEPARESGA